MAHSSPAIPPPCRVCFLTIPAVGSAKGAGRWGPRLTHLCRSTINFAVMHSSVFA